MTFRDGEPDEREKELQIFVQGIFRDLHRVEDYIWLHSRWYEDDDFHTILDSAAESGSRMTFCFLGRDVRFRHDIIKRMLAEGHEVATHGPRHYRIDQSMTYDQVRAAIDPCVAELTSLGATVDGFWSAYFTQVHHEGLEALRDAGISWFSSGLPHTDIPDGISLIPIQDPHDYQLLFIDQEPIAEAAKQWREMAARPAEGIMLFHPFSLTRLGPEILPAWRQLLSDVGGSVPVREWPDSEGRPSLVFDASLQIGWW